MPDHVSVIAALDPDLREALTTKSTGKGLVHLAGHLGAIALCTGLILLKVPLWFVLLPVQGILLTFLFTLEHEATHRTPFAQDWLNDAVGRLCGLVLVLPFVWFRYFHLAHHRWTNQPGNDPELASPKPETRRQWLWHVSGLPYWAAQLRLMASPSLGRDRQPWLPATAMPRIVQEVRGMAVLYLMALATLTQSDVLLWVWIVPMLLGQPFLRVYLLAEHGECPFVANMLENSRTTFTTALVRFLAWNMPYHAEHHSYPTVPFHQLPALHEAIKGALKVTSPGYVAYTRGWLRRHRGGV
jgi:fatty acid desaturase